MKLKASNVDTIKLLPGKTERIVFDDDLSGFGLRIRDGGSRVYVCQYKLGAKQRRITLGSTEELTLVQARSRAKDVLAKVHLGEDPAGARFEAKAKATETLKAVADRFLRHKETKLRPASYYSTRLYLMRHLKPLHAAPGRQDWAPRDRITIICNCRTPRCGVGRSGKICIIGIFRMGDYGRARDIQSGYRHDEICRTAIA